MYATFGSPETWKEYHDSHDFNSICLNLDKVYEKYIVSGKWKMKYLFFKNIALSIIYIKEKRNTSLGLSGPQRANIFSPINVSLFPSLRENFINL